MPSATVSTSDENFARIITAIRAGLDDEEIEGLTDAQIWRRNLKGYYTEMLFRYDRRQAQGAVIPDVDIVDVT